MTVAAIFHERRLQRRFDPGYLGKVDVAFQLLAEFGFVVEFFKLVSIYDGNPHFFGLGRINQHAPGHSIYPPARPSISAATTERRPGARIG